MITHDPLERYLADHGVTFTAIPSARHIALEREWQSIYDNVWRLGMRHKQGARALDEAARRRADTFLIVPFLGNHAGPHALADRNPRPCAYECTGDLPDLSPFASLDFFVAPPDLRWTLLHTHEDHALGGPYFVDRAGLVPPTRRRNRG